VNSPLFPVGARLLAFARELQRAATFVEVLEVARTEVRDAIGFDHAWLCVADEEHPAFVRVLGYSGSRHDLVWDVAPRIPVHGDPMMEEIFAAEGPVVVEDARTDPRTNKALVAQLGNRTIVNVPLRLLDKPFGAFGCGTFGDEGVRVPGIEQIEYLVSMCSQISVAAARIRFVELRRAAEREKHELETRLYRAQKLESLGLLAGGIAHDFANLLTVVLTSASLAAARSKDPLVSEELTAITGAAERGAMLTRQLLAISRTHPVALQAVDVGDRLRSLASLLHRILPERIALELSDDGQAPLVEGDPSQLDQVLMNLCINARDAMPDGGILRIRTEFVPADAAAGPGGPAGGWVAVTVADSGRGMSPDLVERVFEPFSPPSRPAPAPAWDWRWSTASCGSTADRSPAPARWATAPRSASCCRPPASTTCRCRCPPSARATAPAASSSPTTTSTSGRRSAGSSTAPATPRWPSPTATRRAPRCAASTSTSPSSTW
jgi:signal transduction histidine kinase